MSEDGRADSSPDLPAALRRLWGRSARGRRGPKPVLSVTAIVDAALVLADEEGLGAVSMPRVADALGCTSMALYRHIESKEELLSLLVDRVAADAVPISNRLGWRAGLREWVRVQLDGILRHPWVLDLSLASTPLGPGRARWLDQGFSVMRHLDLPNHEKGQILALLSQHVLAEARVQVELSRFAVNPYTDLATTIGLLAGPRDLPYLRAALSGPAEVPEEGLALDLILDGIDTRLRRRSRSSHGPRGGA